MAPPCNDSVFQSHCSEGACVHPLQPFVVPPDFGTTEPEDFFDEAFIDADGTLAPTDGWCKQGVDIAYNGVWG